MHDWHCFWNTVWDIITNDATYGWAAVIVAGAALFWAIKYVRTTVRIAEATERQGEILSSPAVAVRILPFDPKNQPLPLGGIYVEISNHANVHAKMKLTLEARIHNPATNQTRSVPAPAPYDGSVWPLFAQQEFTGHFRFQNLNYQQGEEMRLIGRLETSPYDRINYEQAPQIHYVWKDSIQQASAYWMPCPPHL